MWTGAATFKDAALGMPKLDKIHIRDLRARCIIGIFPEEREKLQELVINITLFADLSEACRSDAIEDTIDYKSLKKSVLALVEASEYFLIEALAGRIAGLCLESPKVARVAVAVDKPGALRFARSVAVKIERERTGHG